MPFRNPAEDTVAEKKKPLPENWPEDVTFLTDLVYTPTALSLSPASLLSHSPSSPSSWSLLPPSHPNLSVPNPSAHILPITSPETHPALGQHGLFASTPLPPDSFIILYLGRLHASSLSDSNSHSDYDLSLDHDLGLSLDAAAEGNESRAANDYRGVRDRPNAEFRDCFVRVPCVKRGEGTRWERRIGIFVLSAGKAGLRKAGIRAGEEILLSYGKGFWEARKNVAAFRRDAKMLRIATRALEF